MASSDSWVSNERMRFEALGHRQVVEQLLKTVLVMLVDFVRIGRTEACIVAEESDQLSSILGTSDCSSWTTTS